MLSAAVLVDAAANRAWEPPPTLSVAEWADENRYLGDDSPEPGKYRTARTPYARQIMDCLSASHPARHVVWEKGVQVGATTVGLNWLGYMIAQCPASTIITLPSEGVAREWSNQRLTQLVESTPVLSGKILESRPSKSGNSMFLKRIAGSHATIKLAWASSAKKLRSTPAANLISDEVDEFEGDVEGEGNPLILLDGRFANFPRGKHLKISTPTSTPSRIHAEFEKGDQRRYFIPCPFCGRFQVLDFHRLKWKDGPLGYECCQCDERIPERLKSQFLPRGMWVATREREELTRIGFDDPHVLASVLAAMEREKFVSFHLPTLYSPLGWYSWATLADDWQKAQGNPSDLKAVINTKLAQVWEARGEAPDAEKLFGRREDYPIGVVPEGGLLLTATGDVQKDRIEFEVKAWGRNRESWSIVYEVLEGDPALPGVWAKLEALIRQDWPHVNGALLSIWACALDTGYMSERGYEFCRRFPQPHHSATGDWVYTPRTVFPVKGGHAWDKAIEGSSDTDAARKRGGLRIITVGSSYLKLTVMGWLRMPHKPGDPYPPCWMHYPDYDYWVFEGLCSESVVTASDGKRRFIKHGRNEPLDCFDEQTEVLTRDGWKPFRHLTFADSLATIDLNTDQMEYQSPVGLVARPHVGPMIQLKGYRLDILVTPNHRMVTYKKVFDRSIRKWRFDVPPQITLAKDLTIHHQLKLGGRWEGATPTTIHVPASKRQIFGAEIEPSRHVPADHFAEFLGWYVTEGCRCAYRSKTQGNIRRNVVLSQNRGPKLDRLLETVKHLPWRWQAHQCKDREHVRLRCPSKQLFDYLGVHCGGKDDTRRVPQWIKDSSADIIRKFLDAAVLGDGWCQESSVRLGTQSRTICTISRQLADDYQELFIKTGYASNITIVKPKKHNHSPQFWVTECRRRRASLDGGGGGKREYIGKPVPYDGMVYCATVPNGTLICRRNGRSFVAGNCAAYNLAAAELCRVRYLKEPEWAELERRTTQGIPGPSIGQQSAAARPPEQRRRVIGRFAL